MCKHNFYLNLTKPNKKSTPQWFEHCGNQFFVNKIQCFPPLSMYYELTVKVCVGVMETDVRGQYDHRANSWEVDVKN